MLTPFGRFVRRMRSHKGVRLKDMADSLAVPSSYISAIENGRKGISENFLASVVAYFRDQDVPEHTWRELAERSKSTVSFDLRGADPLQREAVAAFGQQFNNLSEEKLRRLTELLKEEGD